MGFSSDVIHKNIDKRLFFYDNKFKLITLQLPAKLVVKVLEPLIAENLQFYLKMNAEWLKYVK